MFCFERGRTRSPATIILDRLACVIIITPLKDAVPVAGLTRHCRKSQLDSFLIYEGSHVQSRKTVAVSRVHYTSDVPRQGAYGEGRDAGEEMMFALICLTPL